MMPWKAGTECPHPAYPEFKDALMQASFCYAAEGSDRWKSGTAHVDRAAMIAAENHWPYWAMQRMFNDIKPLVGFEEFMQHLLMRLYR